LPLEFCLPRAYGVRRCGGRSRASSYAEKKIERALVETTPQPRAALLKVGHNGSLTSSAPEFLDTVRPRFAFISVGYRNSFRHPRPEVLQRLAERHFVTFRTDTLGAVGFYLDGEGVRPVLPLHPQN
jgi:competence protein ComEC